MDFKHIAIIMDGNGRWAQKQHKARTFGHEKGSENVREIAIAANDLGVEVLTLYAFSTENWKRPQEEVDFLMALPDLFFKRFLRELMEKNIRIESIGEMDAIPTNTRLVLERAIKETSKNTGMILCFAMNYGSRRELVLAAQRYADDPQRGTQTLDEARFTRYLMTHRYPELDVVIRTSGEYRVSNFLLWQMAYAELVFVPTPWPEFSAAEFKRVMAEVEHRDRRFGAIAT
jgi:undecaprenyl diphosphate synthase